MPESLPHLFRLKKRLLALTAKGAPCCMYSTYSSTVVHSRVCLSCVVLVLVLVPLIASDLPPLSPNGAFLQSHNCGGGGGGEEKAWNERTTWSVAMAFLFPVPLTIGAVCTKWRRELHFCLCDIGT